MTVWPPSHSTSVSRSETFETPCNYVLSKKKIGDGSFSTVFECKNTITGSHYAAKKYSKKHVYGSEEMLQNEFKALQKVSMSHPNILTLIDYFETRDGLYLVTDLCHGGELFDRITATEMGMDELLVREIAAGLVDIVQHLHKNGIVHRDIKAENILFQSKRSNKFLLADFGCARVLSEGETLKDVCGTLSYIAPEVLSRSGHSYGVDIWSIGVVVYFMACSYMPFDCETDQETKEAISKAEYYFEPEEYWSDISAEGKDFIRSCFVVDPENRPTIQELAQHPFLKRQVPRRTAADLPRKGTSGRPKSLISPARLHTNLAKMGLITNLSKMNLNTNLSKMNSNLSKMNLNTNLSKMNLNTNLSKMNTNLSKMNSNLATNSKMDIDSDMNSTRVVLSSNLSHINSTLARMLQNPHLVNGEPAHSLASSRRLYGNINLISSAFSLNHASSLTSRLSLLEKSRSNAMADDVNLKGALCTSPELVSYFLTPVQSTCVSEIGSREASSTDLLSEHEGLAVPNAKSQASFFI